ncbi:molybdenum cofactor biosynthesis protein MoaE [Marinicella sp. S1101]|uniref:molybdenum cofactor biosynthesis protein MoaE n=1 Tax=Marinicella marina TaxID=2996016 RepID=UPI002260DCEC|nr:molybdenum cofactor biosynthesis protein MoaE [Marinicella marina]MCX7553534.1 molybdenum cofactor biosynthesis protein MoaE [Marinicella marina]MDJ1140158.1 molybdenum cofactor biosynthesis protein MoaE [Marinicella marina]
MFSITTKQIDPEGLKQQVMDPRSGGFVCFEGWVRNHNLDNKKNNKAVLELHYEAHEKLATEVGLQIMAEAAQKFTINHACCSHRVGQLKIGDMAIWVGVSADHRQAAFEACEYILNQTKARVPIWKNEHYKDGESGWVEANL